MGHSLDKIAGPFIQPHSPNFSKISVTKICMEKLEKLSIRQDKYFSDGEVASIN